MRKAALQLLLTRPAQVARLCGLDRLTDELHGRWMQEMLLGREDMTLLAHRGSCKTTCLAFAMAAMLLAFPKRNILFMRKTDEDVVEVLRQVKMLLRADAMQHLSALIYGAPVELTKTDMFTVQLNTYAAMKGAPQLLGMGTGGSLTGKHADIVITDDIVNLQDRISAAERNRTRSIYQELQNIRNPGGRILNTGTPWHPQDAISLMPNIRRCDCYHTGLLSEDEILRLRRSMSPSLFAANYELTHIAAEDALFGTCPPLDGAPALLRDGLAHVDAAFGGQRLHRPHLRQVRKRKASTIWAALAQTRQRCDGGDHRRMRPADVRAHPGGNQRRQGLRRPGAAPAGRDGPPLRGEHEQAGQDRRPPAQAVARYRLCPRDGPCLHRPDSGLHSIRRPRRRT